MISILTYPNVSIREYAACPQNSGGSIQKRGVRSPVLLSDAVTIRPFSIDLEAFNGNCAPIA